MANEDTQDMLSEKIAESIELLTFIELDSNSDWADRAKLLRNLHSLSQTIAAATATAVKTAREEDNMSWEKIGNELGMTRQAAWERFGEHK